MVSLRRDIHPPYAILPLGFAGQAFTLDGERVWTQNLASTIAASRLKARQNPNIVGWRKRPRPLARAVTLPSLVAVEGGAPHIIEQEVGALPGITNGDVPERD